MMNNFYLKSTKKLFENEKSDESFEKHIENLIIKYGYNYAMKFKQNAENFVQFYLSSKQRNHRGSNTKNQNLNENEQNYDGLKMSLNCDKNTILNLNEKNEKKFFEIIRDNSNGDASKSITAVTMSHSDSCDGSSEREDKSFLNKKRKCIFDIHQEDK